MSHVWGMLHNPFTNPPPVTFLQMPSASNPLYVFLIPFAMIRVTFSVFFFFFNDTATTEIYTLSLHDALPISAVCVAAISLLFGTEWSVPPIANTAFWNGLIAFAVLGIASDSAFLPVPRISHARVGSSVVRSEEHTSELQSLRHLVCRLLLAKKSDSAVVMRGGEVLPRMRGIAEG